MRSTREAVEWPPRPCPHCGRVLQPRYLDVAGYRAFAGWEPCGCPAAVEEDGRRAAERARAEREAQSAAWLRKVERSGIPPRYREATHERAAGLAGELGQGHGYYLWGGNGTGKTTLACAAALICLARGMTVRFVTATRLLSRLRDFESSEEALGELLECDLLVVDDLGKEGASTPYAAEKLFDMFNERWNGQTLSHPKPLLVTSNFERFEVAERVSSGGAGVAIASRLAGMTRSVEIGGDDGRIA